MNWAYMYHIVLILLLLWGVKLHGPRTWNEEFLSLSQTKVLQGFFALCILLHHTAQKTAASWIGIMYYRKGLDFFVPIGYLCVGIFLFCSGFGLFKSFKTKPDYLKGFFKRRILPLIVAFYSTGIIFLIVRILMKQDMGNGRFWFFLSGLEMPNPNAWFVVALPLFYLGFYLAFRFVKNENAALALTSLVVMAYIIIGLYQYHHDWWLGGEWWYNSAHMFVVGLWFAKFESGIVKHVKKLYWVYLSTMFIAAIVLFGLSEWAQAVFSYYGETWDAPDTIFRRVMCLLSQGAAGIAFTFTTFLITMKVKIGNPVLRFMGGITLEFYLIHGLFVELFCYSFTGEGPGLYYIRNVALYVLVVLVLSVPAAWILKKFHERILGTGKLKKAKHKKEEE